MLLQQNSSACLPQNRQLGVLLIWVLLPHPPPVPPTHPPTHPCWQVALSPFHTPTSKITSPQFHQKVRQLARNYFR